VIAYRFAAVGGLLLVAGGILAVAAPLVADVSSEREADLFLGGLLAAALGVIVQAGTVGLLLARRRPSPELRRRTRDLCLQLGVVGLVEAVWLLTRRDQGGS